MEDVLLLIPRPLEYDNGFFESGAFCVKVCMRFLVACYPCVRRHSRGMGELCYWATIILFVYSLNGDGPCKRGAGSLTAQESGSVFTRLRLAFILGGSCTTYCIGKC
jgi:hypothetical protein